jgi:catechol 2,3-dioxygenase-like lactoylglutathione lyase family enzyme
MPLDPPRYAAGELVLVIDCADLDRSATFWCEVLGYRRMGPAVGQYQGLVPRSGPGLQLLLQRVDDPKQGKNRLHLDLRTRQLEPEVQRVRAAGATVLSAEPMVEFDYSWQVLADPDGNEFCVVQPPSAHWQP